MKKNAFVLCLIVLCCQLLAGCAYQSYEKFSDIMQQSDNTFDNHVQQNNPSSDNNSYSPDINNDFTSTPQNFSNNTVYENGIPVVSDIYSLRKLVNDECSKGNFNVSFIYEGDTDELNSINFSDLRSSPSTSVSYSGNEYTVEFTPYPGEKISIAYLSGDTSALSNDELEVLEIAELIVDSLKLCSHDPIELEMNIHDLLVETIEYKYSNALINDTENIPRHMTAIGAILDGSANCQGYADAFYMLAKMAGFNVGKMAVEAEIGHMVNTIELDGKWYVIDVTFDDPIGKGDNTIPSYSHFNIGRDRCGEYEWNELMEYNPITEYTDEKFYYFSTHYSDYEHNYKKAFDDVEELCQYVIDEWTDTGRNYFNTMLIDNVMDSSTFTEYLSSAFQNTGRACSYSIEYNDNKRDTFFTITIN